MAASSKVYESAVSHPGPSRVVAADGDVTLEKEDADGTVFMSSAGGAAGTLSDGGMLDGQKVTLVMTAFNTNSYTLAVSGGTLTFDAANESATIVSDGTTLFVTCLQGATIV